MTRWSSSLRIVVSGLIAQHPLLGGVTWDYLQYAVGLARLGHDVYYLEDSGQWPYNLDGGPSGDDWVAWDPAPNVEHLRGVMDRFGLGERWAYRFPTRPTWFGLSDARRAEVLATADLLINVSGTLEHPEQYRQVRRLVYVDSDPAFTQVKIARGEADFARRVDAHDVHFSFGERLSEHVPSTGHTWRPTRTPILLSEWHPSAPHRDALTTVMNWTSYQPLTYGGLTYAQKDVELLRFLDLPGRVPDARLEVALSRTEHVDWRTAGADLPDAVQALLNEQPDWTARGLLARAGWHVVDAIDAGGDLDRYRAYVEGSLAEWSVAKNGYVVGQPGWFSCRSACYLAAGRPTIVQDTGFGGILPVGDGILAFRTPAEAAAAIEAVRADYRRHAEAARAIAEQHFDSDRVLTRLLDEALAAPTVPSDESSATARSVGGT